MDSDHDIKAIPPPAPIEPEALTAELQELLRGGPDGIRQWNALANKPRLLAALDLDRASLRGVNLRMADLDYTSLRDADLRGADLSETKLYQTSLNNADFRNANLAMARIDSADLTGANFEDAILSRASLYGVDLSRASFERALLDGAFLQSCDFSKLSLNRAVLDDASLAYARVGGASLLEATLKDADLRGADFSNARLDGARFTNANLSGANLSGATLDRASFDGANLTGANFAGATIDRVRFDGAHMKGAKLAVASASGSTFNDVDLSEADLDRDLLQIAYDTGATLGSAQLRRLLQESKDGLTLFFDTRITRWDRHLIESFILAVLGRATDCRVTMFKEVGSDGALVRLTAERPEDLELVADALWERVWEDSRRQEQQTLAVVRSAITTGLASQYLEGLTAMRDQLDRIELRLPSEEVIADQERQAAESNIDEIRRVVRTWRGLDQKLVGAATDVAEAALSVATGGTSATVIDGAKDAVAEYRGGRKK